MSEHEVIAELRELANVEWVSENLQIYGVALGPVVLSRGGGMYLLDIHPEKGIVRCIHRGDRTILSWNNSAFPDGDPIQNLIKKHHVLKQHLCGNIGNNVSRQIQGVLVFPEAYVDFYYIKNLSPLKFNAIRSSFLSGYMQKKDKRRKPWEILSVSDRNNIIYSLENETPALY